MISIKNYGKKGTDAMIKGMQTEILLAIIITDALLEKMFKRDLILTSVTDYHKPPSLHSKGQAFDMRTWGMNGEDQTRFKKELENLLGDEYDVVIEEDHIHIEFDPKDVEFDPPSLVEEEHQELLGEVYKDREREAEEEGIARLISIENKIDKILSYLSIAGIKEEGG